MLDSIGAYGLALVHKLQSPERCDECISIECTLVLKTNSTRVAEAAVCAAEMVRFRDEAAARVRAEVGSMEAQLCIVWDGRSGALGVARRSSATENAAARHAGKTECSRVRRTTRNRWGLVRLYGVQQVQRGKKRTAAASVRALYALSAHRENTEEEEEEMATRWNAMCRDSPHARACAAIVACLRACRS